MGMSEPYLYKQCHSCHYTLCHHKHYEQNSWNFTPSEVKTVPYQNTWTLTILLANLKFSQSHRGLTNLLFIT